MSNNYYDQQERDDDSVDHLSNGNIGGNYNTSKPCEQSITLAIGKYSNYINSHVLSIRNETVSSSNSNISSLYRSTTSDRGNVSPRCLMFDIKQNVGSSHPLGRTDEGYRSSSGSSSSSNGDNNHSNILWDKNNITTIYRNAHSNPSPVSPIASTYWCDYISSNVSISSKSLCQLPSQITADNLTFSPAVGDLIPLSVYEDYMDNFRYFMEECDYLRTVHVYSDIYDGFSAVACKVLEEINEELPSAVVSLYGITNGHDNQVNHASKEVASKRDMINSLNVPMSYVSMYDFTTIITPIDPSTLCNNSSTALNSNDIASVTAIIATGIDTCSSFQYLNRCTSSSQYQVNRLTSREWCRNISHSGRFHFSNIEVSFPFPISDTSTSYSNGSNSSSCGSGDKGGRDNKTESEWSRFIFPHQDDSNKYNMNPFMTSLSINNSMYTAMKKTISVSRSNIDEDNEDDHDYSTDGEMVLKSLSNIVGIRGNTSNELQTYMTDQYRSKSLLLSQLYQYDVPLVLPKKANKASNAYTGIPVAAAIGAHQSMGGYLSEMHSMWVRNAHRSKAQLLKVGITEDDCTEIAEKLLSYSSAYANNGDGR